MKKMFSVVVMLAFAAMFVSADKGINVDMCGDGVCQEFACMGTGCPKPETTFSCPVDCRAQPDMADRISRPQTSFDGGWEEMLRERLANLLKELRR